ncbi:MAG: amidohydrolase [Bacteroidales bacterium]
MQNVKVHLIQSPLFWEDTKKNLDMFTEKVRAVNDPVDLILLPEMFTTGFTMEPHHLAEPMDGESMQWMRRMAGEKQAVLAGTMIINENDRFFNRLIWMRPDGTYAHYDKKHLFTYAGENKNYTPGTEKLIVELQGWKIMPIICYDMRFPAWCRNSYDPDSGFAYDCILNVANWPGSRSHAWRILLMARAIENQAYMIGVNRIGTDGNDISYTGDSAVISPKGENLSNIMPDQETSETVVMPRCQLDSFRDAFRPWADWDTFRLG